MWLLLITWVPKIADVRLDIAGWSTNGFRSIARFALGSDVKLVAVFVNEAVVDDGICVVVVVDVVAGDNDEAELLPVVGFDEARLLSVADADTVMLTGRDTNEPAVGFVFNLYLFGLNLATINLL